MASVLSLMTRIAVAITAFMVVLPATLAAQRLDSFQDTRNPPSVSFRFARPVRALDTRPAETHLWTGVALGGALGGILGVSIRASQCDDRETAVKETCPKSTLKWGLIGAATGAVLGGFVGQLIEK